MRDFFACFLRENKIRPYSWMNQAEILMIVVSEDLTLCHQLTRFFLKHNFCQIFSDFPRILALRVQFLQKEGFFWKSYFKNVFFCKSE